MRFYSPPLLTVRVRSITDFLQAGGGIGELIPQAEKLLALRRLVGRLLPPNLAPAAQVANLKGPVLLIRASNNAVAAKLRHFTPSLMRGLAEQGYHVEQVRIEVRPTAPDPVVARPPRLLPAAGASALARLGAELPEGRLREVVRVLANKTT
jgi:hypothetical protein